MHSNYHRIRHCLQCDAVRELIKEEKTINQLAADLGVRRPQGVCQLKEWKKIALQGLPALYQKN